MLQDGEMVEADKGYRSEYYSVWTPVNYEGKEEQCWKAVVLAWHEAVNQ